MIFALFKKQLGKKSVRIELLILLLILAVTAAAHGVNMFHYPYYESDEGTYLAQAWSFVTKGELAPYTYWYDHAPAGWIFIGLWSLISGGFFSFGFSINSGRVFMLLLHLLSVVFLYFIAKKLTNGKRTAPIVATLIFSLSPLAIYFQRRLLLDNIMVFWVLLSLLLLLYYGNRLRFIVFSAMAFAIAALSKETAVFFVPAFIYILYKELHKGHRKFALAGWIGVVGTIVSLYFLYALLKGEMFPTGTFLGGDHPHVSLLESLKFQSGRSGGGPFSSSGGSFMTNISGWFRKDPILIIGGALATVVSLLIGFKQYSARVVAILALSIWAYLMRGGLVIEFYVVPLIPFIALAIGYCLNELVSLTSKFRLSISRTLRFVIFASFVLTMFAMVSETFGASSIKYSTYNYDHTTPQKQAVEWLLEGDRPNQFVAIDMYSYLDIHENGEPRNFGNAEYYWKVEKDPEIRNDILHKDPKNIDYLIMTLQMKKDLQSLPFLKNAADHSKEVAEFSRDGYIVKVLKTEY